MVSRWWHVLTIGVGVLVGISTWGAGAPLSIILIAGGATALVGSLSLEVAHFAVEARAERRRNAAAQVRIQYLEERADARDAEMRERDIILAGIVRDQAALQAEQRMVAQANAHLVQQQGAMQRELVEMRADIAEPGRLEAPDEDAPASDVRRPARL